MHGDGDGWVRCERGHRHWGRHGAAGLLLRHDRQVLVQLRAEQSHHGGTWGLPGGARDSDESPVATALREAAEEIGLVTAAAAAIGAYVDDHGGWTYTTVLALARRRPEVGPANWETQQVRWVQIGDVAALDLHPGLAASWPRLRGAPTGLTLVVDVANVVGSRPDGWWRDRAGAARRLHGTVTAAAARGLSDVPGGGAVQLWYPEPVLVVEGAARTVADLRGVVAAPRSGDDAIVAEVARARAAEPDRLVGAVTADRELRERCTGEGALVAGPRWLLDQLPPC